MTLDRLRAAMAQAEATEQMLEDLIQKMMAAYGTIGEAYHRDNVRAAHGLVRRAHTAMESSLRRAERRAAEVTS